MTTLSPDERATINFRLARPPQCPARGFAVKLWSGRVTPEDQLDMRQFAGQISQPCFEVWIFKRLYDDYRIRRHEDQRRQEDHHPGDGPETMAQNDDQDICVYNGLLSRCTEKKWLRQKACPFSVKAVVRDECLYYVADGHRCWLPAASDKARQKHNE